MNRIALLLLPLLAGTASAQDPHGRPPELEALDRFVGTWEFTITKMADGGPPVEKVIRTYTWTLNRRFLSSKTYKGADKEQIYASLSTFDPAKGAYRSWVFGNRGQSRDVTGTWNEKENTFEWKGAYAPKVNYTNVTRFEGKDRVTWKTTLTDDEGTVLHWAEGTMKRVGVEF